MSVTVARNSEKVEGTVQFREAALLKTKNVGLENYKRTLCCQICGDKRHYVLDFHHRDSKNKVAEVSILMQRNNSLHKVMEEINKCDVLCANCHREKHYKERLGS